MSRQDSEQPTPGPNRDYDIANPGARITRDGNHRRCVFAGHGGRAVISQNASGTAGGNRRPWPAPEQPGGYPRARLDLTRASFGSCGECGAKRRVNFDYRAVTVCQPVSGGVYSSVVFGTPYRSALPAGRGGPNLIPSRTASLTFARSRRSSGGSAMTASWISASIVSGLSSGFSAYAHHRPGRGVSTHEPGLQVLRHSL